MLLGKLQDEELGKRLTVASENLSVAAFSSLRFSRIPGASNSRAKTGFLATIVSRVDVTVVASDCTWLARVSASA